MSNITRSLSLLVLTLIIAPALCAQPRDVAGWQDAVWGMHERDLIATFGPRLRKLKKRAEFVSVYADYTIPDFEVAARTYTVFFEMDNRTGRLSQVLVRLNEMKSKVPREDVFTELETLLTRTLGDPTSKIDKRPNYFGTSHRWIDLNRTWRFRTTTIELVYDWSNYVDSSVLGIKYIQAANK